MNIRTRAALVTPWVLLAAWGCGSAASESGFDAPKPLAEVEITPPPGDFGPRVEPTAKDPDSGAPKALCGNAVKDPGETCDDGNASGGDGCSATCTLEPGWKCAIVGAACAAAACGDALAVGDEDCDDGNRADGDGCSQTCVLEAGYKCVGPSCAKTTCGDGIKEGTEQCDDNNLRPYDGCSPDCTIEPTCAGGACTAVCGDGVKFPGEACDDGNKRNGDGCSATCTLEPGFTCSVQTSDLPDSVDIPILYRDFTPTTNPDFESWCCGQVSGLVKTQLGADSKPEFLDDGTLAGNRMLTDANSFFQWYHDVPNVNMVSFSKLTFQKQPDNSYRYFNGSFFPLDGEGFGDFGGSGHNFHFTSELRSVFTYGGDEVLDFSGDDDVWVFINGKLAVDIGGVHGETPGTVTLNDAKATELGLVKGSMYEFAVFQAERHTTESNYKLTLRGFTKAKTTCAPICGDGVKTKNEACDDGKNLGGYGQCAPGCVLGPRCGDGTKQITQGEQCDDGNLVNGDGCSSTCQTESIVPN